MIVHSEQNDLSELQNLIYQETMKDFPETCPEEIKIDEGKKIVEIMQEHDNQKESMLEKLLELRFGEEPE